ncbi:AAA family ATPase [Algimonas porphyrae]|uniref:ATPase AAA n=1 Tax=Algimonas porphyrae TaxID=1128113 RepID=A0ABQ5UXW7_9PROT|nr:MoxR family ATPase [Algimonas porphyrae]GLQ20126.1 ATPase AAA [Algimonas porphyrae]
MGQMLDTKVDPATEKAAEVAVEMLAKARSHIGEVVYGQDHVVNLSLAAILSGGHALLVGVPGLAKTLLVETLGTVLGLKDARIQFTPDLMPADILGSEVLDQDEDGKRVFRFIKGPVFTQLLMADEINRASPRTQSALLQAMQERSVTIAGKPHALPKPFHVLATQNPIEQEGTYPLPEAQLDRFLFQIDVGFPELATERDILISTTGATLPTAKKAMTAKSLVDMQTLVRKLPVGDSVLNAILSLVRNARPDQSEIDSIRKTVAWGPGPRAGQALMLATRAKALIEGRVAPSVDDVIALAGPVLRHRMALSFAARAEGATIDATIDQLKAHIR